MPFPYSRRVLSFILVVGYCAVTALQGGCSKSSVPFDLSKATFVGHENCVSCHQEEAQQHVGSHHDQAMQLASEATVLGDFDNAQIEHHGVVSRMFRDGNRFVVNTEGPDGQMTDFEVKYVFGLTPLQQYMIEFPAEGQTLPATSKDGKDIVPRVQVLRLCWDTNKNEWFYLPPPDVAEKLDPSDDLHWTGIAQRWNNMCADCHSTDYQKHFIPPEAKSIFASIDNGDQGDDFNTLHANLAGSDRGEYRSTFMEINVSCEACHGPGSKHVELAQQWFPGWNRERGYGLANLKATAENQIQACAPCHSRRNVVSGGFQAGDNFYDYYASQLLTEGIYYPDGQILDEDYVHGSFLQSKMYHKGIKCTDCHDPHTAKLKHDGNQVCTSCHQHPAAKYDSVAHHFHKPTIDGQPAPAAQCVNCHMPSTTYMAVDARRDHSFRIPRPDLSTAQGTPNACTGCHLKIENVSPEKHDQLKLYQDWMQAARAGDAEVQAELERANQWCDAACEQWYGEKRRRDEHFGIAISAGQQGLPEAKELLLRLLGRRGPEAPALARATALQVLQNVDPEEAADQAVKAVEDDHPTVRATAASQLIGGSNASRNIQALEKLLKDPVRSVRTEAARNLIEYPREMWSDNARSALTNALTELEQGLAFSNDRSGAHLALGILAEQQSRIQQAITHYEAAISVEPAVTGPRSNLARLLERNLANATGDQSGIERQVKRLRKEELSLLERDVRLLPDAAAIQYRYGLALYLDGQAEQALAPLIRAAELEPTQPMYAQTVAMLHEKLEKWDEAIAWAEKALELADGEPSYQQLLESIRAAARASQN